MAVRVTQQDSGPEWVETPLEEREVTVEGISYHFSKNEKKSFADDSIGQQVAAFSSDDKIVEDSDPGEARS